MINLLIISSTTFGLADAFDPIGHGIIKASRYSAVISSNHTFSKVFINSSIDFGFCFLILALIRAQTFSMGLRSGLFPGQSKDSREIED